MVRINIVSFYRIAACVLFSCWSIETLATDDCSADALVSDIRKNLEVMSSYQLSANVSLGGSVVVSQISGRPSERLRIDMNIAQGGDSIEIKAVFDGSHQWVETRGSSRVEVLKISLSELVNSQRPFDTSYYLMGSGLLNGEDFPASLFTLLATYEFKAVCERGIVTLSGTLDEEEFAKYALTKRSQASVESRVRQYSERFSQLVMEFDQLSLGIKGYELGAVGERAIFRVDFKNLQVNEKLPVNHFFYRAPKDVKVVDITEELLLRLRSAE